jgi:multicomponent Na+:H+ antiporter subunit A
VATPLAVVLAAYLFFAGHNQPGGGFAAGLVLGCLVVLRTVAGLRRPGNSLPYLAVGGLVVAAVALIPVLFGHELLDQVVVEGEVPLLGKVKSGSAAVFDLGVTLIVVGLVAAMLDALADFGDPEPDETPLVESGAVAEVEGDRT